MDCLSSAAQNADTASPLVDLPDNMRFSSLESVITSTGKLAIKNEKEDNYMDAKLTWQNGMAFRGISGSTIPVALDASIDHGGRGEGIVPMEMILMGLGGCTAMDVISILTKKRQEVTSFEIILHADRADEHPKVFTDITIEYVVKGKGLDPVAVERAVDLSENKYCPGMAMLRKAANIKTSFRIEQD